MTVFNTVFGERGICKILCLQRTDKQQYLSGMWLWSSRSRAQRAGNHSSSRGCRAAPVPAAGEQVGTLRTAWRCLLEGAASCFPPFPCCLCLLCQQRRSRAPCWGRSLGRGMGTLDMVTSAFLWRLLTSSFSCFKAAWPGAGSLQQVPRGSSSAASWLLLSLPLWLHKP